MHFSLGIHIGHDRGAALINDGELVAAIAEERLDRLKHSNSPDLPVKAIKSVLLEAGVQRSEIAVIGISYTNVVIDNILGQLRDEILDFFSPWTPDIIGCEHHDCHAYSTYYTSTLENPLIIVADGAGDIVGSKLEAESAYVWQRGGLTNIGQRLQDFGMVRLNRRNSYNIDYMHPEDFEKQISVGRKYEQLTYLLGFGHGQSGKTMGLAAGYAPLVPPPSRTPAGFDFSLTFSDILREIHAVWRSSGQSWHHFLTCYRGEIAATAQAWTEAIMTSLIDEAMKLEKRRNLCLAGGLFLNCTMNHKLLQLKSVEKVHIIPAAGDDGQCIGAAFIAYQAQFGDPDRDACTFPYLGCSYSEAEIQDELVYFGLPAKKMDDGWLAEQIAKDIDAGLVVGMFRGRSELGPRALGHRSLLADPRRQGMKDSLNLIKGRELFRPFAPMVTWEDQFEYFNLEAPSTYMLFAAEVKDIYREDLPAITHVDGSARVQAVKSESDAFLHSLLRAIETQTGFPIVLNTSFNLAGDPIVESPHDAIATFLSSAIDRLVLGSYYLSDKSNIGSTIRTRQRNIR